ncbi:MAG: SemiSWEET family transporter [Micrococcales bacterium]
MDTTLMHAIGEAFGLAGGTLGTVVAVPQVIRIRKMGHSEGVSLLPYLLLCVTYSAWFTYGLMLGSPSLIISNVLTYITGALVIVAILGNSLKSYGIMAGISAATILFVNFSPEVVVQGLLVVLTFSRLPQLIVSWKNRKRDTATAVSLGSLFLALTGASLWMAYSFLTEHPFFIITTSLAIALSLATFLVEWRISLRARQLPL